MSQGIPYTIEPRPDTGLTNGRIGLWLFLASELMLFAGLYAGYLLLRTGTPDWPSGRELLQVEMAGLNTVVLLAASWTMWRAVRAIGRDDYYACRGHLLSSFLLGAVFVGVKLTEYRMKWADGLVPATDNFYGTYYVLTGVHALHVLGGLLATLWLLGPGGRLFKTEPRHFVLRVGYLATYWYFVDSVWLVIFPSLYLV